MLRADWDKMNEAPDAWAARALAFNVEGALQLRKTRHA